MILVLTGFKSISDAVEHVRANGRTQLVDPHGEPYKKLYINRYSKTLLGKPLYAIARKKTDTSIVAVDINGDIVREYPSNVRWNDVA